MRNNRLVLGWVFAFSLLLLVGCQSKSQVVSGESDIKNLLTDFFSAMKSKNLRVLQGSFHADAIMNTTLDAGDFATLGNTNVADFISRVETSPSVLDEEILSMAILIDGNMAHAWTPYRFYVDGNFSHCGVNSFQLIRTEMGWKIVHIIDTRNKEGCD
ncbi:nuclear transport factor 2 family protein [Lunatibacter salilacus]|uniref:nuclear transport factor 2 family protein n=1 Tax=Lunatibacter salilacus TaxID=2483804 RepID=UPI001F212A85|nr:nuclear transport factor 2 family protein [Lunatibacter salilacus]